MGKEWPPFTHEEKGAQRSQDTCRKHTASESWGLAATPRSDSLSPCSPNLEKEGRVCGQGLRVAAAPLHSQKLGQTGSTAPTAPSPWNESCDLLPLPCRSPWSNKYDPPLEDGAMPSARLRKLEVEANNAFDQYRDL